VFSTLPRTNRAARTSAFRPAGVAICAAIWACIALPAAAQTPASRETAPRAEAAQDPTAQQIREELDRLRREFESVRDSYGARLTALETKLAQLQGPGAAAPPPTEQPPAAGAPPVSPPPAGTTQTATVPQGAAGAG